MNVMGWVMSTSDVYQRPTTILRDVLGRAYKVTNARGDAEEYTFDALHRVSSVKNGNGYFRYYNYTPRGELRQIIFGDGTIEKYQYDGNGNQTTKTNGNNQVITYGYDNVDNLNLVTYPDKSPTSFTYDNDGRQLTMADSTGSHSWAYNWADQLTQLTTPQGTMGYEYDAWGRRNKLIEGSQSTVYTYQNDKLHTITKAGESVSATFLYDQYGRLQTKGANGITTTYGYDALDRVNYIAHQNGNTTLHQETYNYDLASNLSSKLVNSVATYYTYDDIDQLMTENGGGIANSYTYDNNGNRLTKTSTAGVQVYSYDAADKLLQTIGVGGTRTYGYDLSGRTTSIQGPSGTRILTWNSDDRLMSISGGGIPTTSYNYNDFGARVSKSNANGSRTYKRDGVEVVDDVLSDAISTMVPGISERAGAVNRNLLEDHLGSTKAMATSASVSDTMVYDAFGVVTSRTGTTNTQKGFVGEEGYQEDSESGYKLLGHRYYDPETGRFLSRDPMQDGGNWYVYCDNNPLAVIDPSGLSGVGQLLGPIERGEANGKLPKGTADKYRKDPAFRRRFHDKLKKPKYRGKADKKGRKDNQNVPDEEVWRTGRELLKRPIEGDSKFVGPPKPPKYDGSGARRGYGSRQPIPIRQPRMTPQQFDDWRRRGLEKQVREVPLIIPGPGGSARGLARLIENLLKWAF